MARVGRLCVTIRACIFNNFAKNSYNLISCSIPSSSSSKYNDWASQILIFAKHNGMLKLMLLLGTRWEFLIYIYWNRTSFAFYNIYCCILLTVSHFWKGMWVVWITGKFLFFLAVIPKFSVISSSSSLIHLEVSSQSGKAFEQAQIQYLQWQMKYAWTNPPSSSKWKQLKVVPCTVNWRTFKYLRYKAFNFLAKLFYLSRLHKH